MSTGCYQKPFEVWQIGQCLYTCTPCGTGSVIFNSSVMAAEHARSEHNLSWNEFNRMYPGTR